MRSQVGGNIVSVNLAFVESNYYSSRDYRVFFVIAHLFLQNNVYWAWLYYLMYYDMNIM